MICIFANTDSVVAFQTASTGRRQSKNLILQLTTNNNNDLLPAPLQKLRSPSSGSNDATTNKNDNNTDPPLQFQIQVETLSRILVPSFIASFSAFLLFPPLSLGLSYLINDSATFAVLSVDSSQFIQNFLTVTGLTFSILVGQTYYFMYQQQEAVFVSLFGEVTEAKSLLEQVALVCQGRREMYELCLVAVKRYVLLVVLLIGIYDDAQKCNEFQRNHHFLNLMSTVIFPDTWRKI